MFKYGFYLSLVLMLTMMVSIGETASISIVPDTFSEDYLGDVQIVIVLDTPGQTVRVAMRIDANGNAVPDPEDWVLRWLGLTDGAVPSLPNDNLFFDMDGQVNGEILVSGGFKEPPSFVGHFLMELGDGNTILATTPVTITPRRTQQSISGRLLDQRLQPIVGGVVLTNSVSTGREDSLHITDSNGRYTYFGHPDIYWLTGIYPGKLTNYNRGSAQMVRLAADGNIIGIDLIVSDAPKIGRAHV